ncbi:DNA internalization-related competence protein ComEC/Rec2 [Halalkalibaculum sp. DA384]|uniref:DNA internalization-related competence protein ComEC/Rec2 n=1 Tax=Halalkalibaculum sp. DA384 TaxID=3373606 RepID=UPI0037550EF7
MRGQSTYQFPFEKYPAVRIALLFAAGITVDYYFNLSLSLTVGLLVPAVVLLFAVEFKSTATLNPLFHQLSVGTYLLLVFLFGMAWHSIHDKLDRPEAADILEAYTWDQISAKGSVYNIKPTSTGKLQVDVAVDTTLVVDSLRWVESYNLRAVLDPETDHIPDQLQLGSSIRFSATVYPLEQPRNPHQFDYKGYLESQGIYTQAGIESIDSVHNPKTLLSWHHLRQLVLDQIEQNFDSTSQSLAKALLIGYKNELDRADKIAFSRAGLSHIMAVSGLHVGFIVAPFWVLIPWFWTLRYGKEIGLALLLTLLFFYAGLTGFSASVCRASLTVGLITFGKLFHKVRDSLNLTAVSALILLLANPADLFAPGFQLSFSAVYIILLTVPVVERWLPHWVRYRWYGTPVMVVIVSILVQVGLFPLLTYHFGEFSLIGPLANGVVVPWLGFVVPYALFLLPVAAVFPAVGLPLNVPNQWFLNELSRFTEWASRLNWSWIQLHVDSPLVFGLWIAGLFLMATLHISRLRWKILSILLLLLTVQSGRQLVKKIQPAKLTITVFDVGQGDATLVSTPGGRHFLIDTGRWSPGYNSAKYVILPHLKAEGIDKLDAVFLTHPHADHIGGISELIEHVAIDTIYNSGYAYSSNLYQQYHSLARRHSIPVKTVNAGQSIVLDPSVLLLSYGPIGRNYGSDPNDHSLILELIYGQTEFLFVGDAERGQEQRLLNHYGNLLDTDFLKAGHHGSRTSSSSRFLHEATPDISVLSLAKSNRFQHPHPEAVRRLRRYSEKMKFTSLHKALIFSSDGTSIRQIPW